MRSPPSTNRFGLKQMIILLTSVAVLVRIALALDPQCALRGRVFSFDGTIPGDDVSVWVESLDQEIYAETKTGLDGRFTFPRLPKGPYNLGIKDPNATAVAVKSFSLQSGSQAPSLVVSEGGIITGSVLAQNGLPMSVPRGSKVQLHGPSHPENGHPREAVIRADGSYRIRAAAGTNRLHFTVGLYDFDYSIEIENGETREIHFGVEALKPPRAYFRDPQTGHFYTALATGGTWEESLKTAGRERFRGLTGHLVTITSADENQQLVDWFADRGFSWTAGTDRTHEGRWCWAAGPERGKSFYKVGEWTPHFHQWDRVSDNLEPDNIGDGQHYMAWNAVGWKDRSHSVRGLWKDWDGDRLSDCLIVEFSPQTSSVDHAPARQHNHTAPKRMQPPQPTSEATAQTLPSQLVAACVTWNEAWVVYGMAKDCSQWHTWVSPAVARPGRTLCAQNKDFVAIVGHRRDHSTERHAPYGWLLMVSENRWIPIPPVPVENTYDLAFIELIDQRLLVVGESGSKGYAAVFDLCSADWISACVAPHDVDIRSGHAVVENSYLNWATAGKRGVVFDFERNVWSRMTESPLDFDHEIATCAYDDEFVVCGGRDSRQRLLAAYTPTGNSWQLMAKLPPMVHPALGSIRVGDSFFILSIDEQTDVRSSTYNFLTNEWRRAPAAPLPRMTSPHIRPVDDDKVMVYGGWDPVSERFIRDAAMFDLGEQRWRRLPPVPGDVLAALHRGS